MNAARAADAVLFDLDGTLADTAPDLINAPALLRAELGLEPTPPSGVREAVSRGGPAILRAALPDGFDRDALVPRYLDLYREHICVRSALFADMDRVLDGIERSGLPWGIVTNKAGWLTGPLLEALNLHKRAGCVVCGDTLPQRKPDPAPVLLACTQLGALPARTAFVGDDERDVQAAHAAGAIPVVAGWGYFPAGAADGWGAPHRVEHPLDLLAWLGLADART